MKSGLKGVLQGVDKVLLRLRFGLGLGFEGIWDAAVWRCLG